MYIYIYICGEIERERETDLSPFINNYPARSTLEIRLSRYCGLLQKLVAIIPSTLLNTTIPIPQTLNIVDCSALVRPTLTAFHPPQ